MRSTQNRRMPSPAFIRTSQCPRPALRWGDRHRTHADDAVRFDPLHVRVRQPEAPVRAGSVPRPIFFLRSLTEACHFKIMKRRSCSHRPHGTRAGTCGSGRVPLLLVALLLLRSRTVEAAS